MSKINLQRGKLTVENRKSREKTDMLRSIGKQSGDYVVLYPQNGDPIVTIDYVTSRHPVYTVYE